MSKRLAECSIEEIEQRLQQGEIIAEKGPDGVSVFRKSATGYSHEWRPRYGQCPLVAILDVPTLTELLLMMVFGPNTMLEPAIVDAESQTNLVKL